MIICYKKWQGGKRRKRYGFDTLSGGARRHLKDHLYFEDETKEGLCMD